MNTRELETKELRYLACRDRRDLPLELCDLKFEQRAKDDDPIRFEGYASVWGRTDAYGDTILKGSFIDSLKERRPMMLFGHSPGRVPGKWLKWSEDEVGLRMKGELTPGHSEARDIAASLKHGSLNGLSIGGYSVEWEPKKAGGRTIAKFDLYEVSIVSMPAEQEARIDTASVKQMLDQCTKVSEIEDLLREAAGCSKQAATAIVSRLGRLLRGDPEGSGLPSATDKAAADLLSAMKDNPFPTF